MQSVIITVMNLLIRELAKPTSVLSVAGFIRSRNCVNTQYIVGSIWIYNYNFWRAQKGSTDDSEVHNQCKLVFNLMASQRSSHGALASNSLFLKMTQKCKTSVSWCSIPWPAGGVPMVP